MARVYVSSTFSDLKDCREQVSSVLRRLGHVDVAMEHYAASDDRPLDRCLRDVAECDLYVGIFAWRYGFVPEGHDHSITHLEYQEAVKKDVPRLLFLIADDAPWPMNVVEHSAIDRTQALREELKKDRVVDYFRDAPTLTAAVSQAVANWQKEQGGAAAAAVTDWEAYRRRVYEEHQEVRLSVIAGASRDRRPSIPLAEVFVPQLVTSEHPAYEVPESILEERRKLFGDLSTADDLVDEPRTEIPPGGKKSEHAPETGDLVPSRRRT